MKKILYKTAEELFALAISFGMLAGEIVFTPYGQLRLSKLSRSTYHYKLRKFEKHGLVKRVKKPTGSIYVLSCKAKLLRNRPVNKTNRIDGLSTIIMFDVPEDKHRARDNFRRYLIRNGYTQIQKSVFISPFKVSKELVEFIHELKLVSNVSIISGKIDPLPAV